MKVMCSICQDRLSETDILASTKCGHVFHVRCLLQWLKTSTTCPRCRTETSKDFRRVFFDVDEETPQADLQRQNSRLRKQVKVLKTHCRLLEATVKRRQNAMNAYRARVAEFVVEMTNAQERFTNAVANLHQSADPIPTYFHHLIRYCKKQTQ